eukprot:14376018-Alexandrium_andersonii.AAC.1
MLEKDRAQKQREALLGPSSSREGWKPSLACGGSAGFAQELPSGRAGAESACGPPAPGAGSAALSPEAERLATDPHVLVSSRKNASSAEVNNAALRQLVLDNIDMEWLFTTEGWMIKCLSTKHVMPGRLREVEEYLRGRAHQQALARWTGRD